MAKSLSPADVEDAAIRSGQAAETAFSVSLRENLRATLDICQRCTRWTHEMSAANARTLDSLSAALATALSSLDGRADVSELAGVVDHLWRTSAEEIRRRQGDLPFALASLQFEVARAGLDRVQHALDHSVRAAAAAPGADMVRLAEQAHAAFDQWMRQWSTLWHPRPVQIA